MKAEIKAGTTHWAIHPFSAMGPPCALSRRLKLHAGQWRCLGRRKSAGRKWGKAEELRMLPRDNRRSGSRRLLPGSCVEERAATFLRWLSSQKAQGFLTESNWRTQRLKQDFKVGIICHRMPGTGGHGITFGEGEPQKGFKYIQSACLCSRFCL